MPPDSLADIRASYDRLLAGTGDYHEQLRQQLERPDLDAVGRERAVEALTCATQLVEVLESVTFDRIQRLTALRAPS
jgi:hypothetical protein